MRALSLTTVFLTLISVFSVYALDIEAGGTFGNLGFAEDRKETDTDLGADSYNWGLHAILSLPLSPGLQLTTGIERDPMTENRIRLAFTHDSQYVTMSVGTYLGVLESFDSPLQFPSGIAASLEARLPGVGYAQVAAGRPLNQEPTTVGEYWQQHTEVGIGFNLPNVIAGFHFRTAQKLTATTSGQTRDERTEYALTTDIFSKNVPYTVFLTFGYRDYRRVFLVGGEADTTHAAGSLLFGARVNVSLTSTLSFFTGLSNGVYTFGREALLGSFAESDYLFQTEAGVSLSLN